MKLLPPKRQRPKRQRARSFSSTAPSLGEGGQGQGATRTPLWGVVQQLVHRWYLPSFLD
jgi:hypothetical protein